MGFVDGVAAGRDDVAVDGLLQVEIMLLTVLLPREMRI